MSGSLRNVGIDDGYFPPEFKARRGRTVLVAVLCEGVVPVDAEVGLITVDGTDATSEALNLLRELNNLGGLDVVFLDGVTYAGFNFIDPRVIYRELGYPVIVVFKHDLDLPKVERALKKNFRDWERRLEVITSVYSVSTVVRTRWRELRVSPYGLKKPEVTDILNRLQTISPYPESLRLSDVVASGLSGSPSLTPLLTIE